MSNNTVFLLKLPLEESYNVNCKYPVAQSEKKSPKKEQKINITVSSSFSIQDLILRAYNHQSIEIDGRMIQIKKK